jgi:predicted transcriptional regulator
VPKAVGKLGPSFRRLLAQAAEEAGITNTEIARRLDVTQSAVTQTLKRENMTERVFRDYVAAMGFEIQLVKKGKR